MLKAADDTDRQAIGSGVEVPYLNEHERRQYEVTVERGRLYRSDSGGNLQPMNTKNYDMFVMDGKGTIYAGDEDKLEHHSAFLAGGPVAAAGTMTVENGQLQRISDQSGHYQPTRDHSDQFVTEMRRRRVDLSTAQLELSGKSKAEYAASGHTAVRVYPDGVLRTKPY